MPGGPRRLPGGNKDLPGGPRRFPGTIVALVARGGKNEHFMQTIVISQAFGHGNVKPCRFSHYRKIMVPRGVFQVLQAGGATQVTHAFLQQQNRPMTPSRQCLHQPDTCEAWPVLLCAAVGKVRDSLKPPFFYSPKRYNGCSLHHPDLGLRGATAQLIFLGQCSHLSFGRGLLWISQTIGSFKHHPSHSCR